jgi:hypothetical protein
MRQHCISVKVILETLGVAPFKQLDADELNLNTSTPIYGFSTEEYAHTTLVAPFCCLDLISSWIQMAGSRVLRLPETIKSVFFHSMGHGESTRNCEQALQQLLNDQTAMLVPVKVRSTDFVFSGKENDICGPLTGLTIKAEEDMHCWRLVSKVNQSDTFSPLITVDMAGVLIRIKQKNLNIFMLFTSHLADLDQFLEVNLDIRTCLLSLAAPMVILKYLSRGVGWSARNTYANLIIDDPPLALRYGHIDFKRLYDLAVKYKAAITLAYIPLNYRRGNDEVVRFFQEVSDRFAICIHGCDHTKSEFGGTESSRISTLAHMASKRMALFSERTGIPHTKIMVFPQGIFSSQALDVLKQHDFNAVVNTELRDTTGEKRVTIKDILQPAITCYGSLPLFLRRKICDGIANIAFDLLLEKPCLIVAHHDDFSSDMSNVRQLFYEISRLPNPPEWKPLEDITARTSLSKKVGKNITELKIYSRIADLRNIPCIPSENFLRVIRDESYPEMIKCVLVGQCETPWRSEEGRIVVDAGKYSESAKLAVLYRQDIFTERPPLPIKYRISTWCRRFLSEFRDNYVSKSPALQNMVQTVRKFI